MKASAILERDKRTGVKTVRYYNLSKEQYKKLHDLMMLNGRDHSFELIRSESQSHAIDLDSTGRKMGVKIHSPQCSMVLFALESRMGISIDNDPN